MNKITTYLIVGLMSMVFSCSFGQENDTFSPKFKAAKMYANSDFYFLENSPNFISLLRTFSPSIAWGREYGNFHEISAQDFSLSFTDNAKSFSSTVDYSYNARIGSYNPERKVNFYAGGGVRVGSNINTYISNSSDEFKSRNSNLSFDLVFTPRMTVKLGKRTFLDVNIPYSFYNVRRSSYFANNPSVPVENRKGVNVKSATFPNQLTVRVGVAIKF